MGSYQTITHYTKESKMFVQFLKDPWTYIATFGTTFFISIQWVAQNLTPLASFVGALIGIGVLVMGFRSKIIENKNMDQERINLKLEEEIKRAELARIKRNQ